MVFTLGIIGIFVSTFFAMIILMGGRPYSFLLPLFGWKKIQFYNGQHSFNPPFVSYAKWDKDGVLIKEPVRYNLTGIGHVRLFENGKADYCGSYDWKIVQKL